MLSLYNILENIIIETKNMLSESVPEQKIYDAIENKYRVNITYDDDKGGPIGKRQIEVYALGDIDGYPAIRAYQLSGNTRTENAVWKTFRVDRIMTWEPVNFKFYNPVSDRDNTGSIPKYREDGMDTTLGGQTNPYAKFDDKYRKR
jgi:predicted DNA-binding transcriptional regulator YafY